VAPPRACPHVVAVAVRDARGARELGEPDHAARRVGRAVVGLGVRHQAVGSVYAGIVAEGARDVLLIVEDRDHVVPVVQVLLEPARALARDPADEPVVGVADECRVAGVDCGDAVELAAGAPVEGLREARLAPGERAALVVVREAVVAEVRQPVAVSTSAPESVRLPTAS